MKLYVFHLNDTTVKLNLSIWLGLTGKHDCIPRIKYKL